MNKYSKDNFIHILKTHQSEYNYVVPFYINSSNLLVLDLSNNNRVLQSIDFTDTANFTRYIFESMNEANTPIAIGKYNEDRIIYRQSENFQGYEPRSVHLGIDLWAAEGTEIFSPLPGVIHSFNDNPGFGNYGPTLILQHQLQEFTFYTLYGHLSRKSLEKLAAGKPVNKGEKIATLGEPIENGGWPPHLHFQIMRYMLGWKGDFPGVAAPSKKDFFLNLCPDPNLIIQISGI